MARGGRNYPLVIYREVLSRWWPETRALGILLAALAWPVHNDPLGQAEPWRWKGMLAVGIGTILDTGIIVSAQDGARQVRAVVPSLAASLATTLIVLVPLLFLDFAAAGIRQVAAAVGLLLVVSFAVDVLFLPAFFLDSTGRQVLLPARPAAGRLRQWRAGLRRASHRGVRLLHALVRFAARRPAARPGVRGRLPGVGRPAAGGPARGRDRAGSRGGGTTAQEVPL